MWNLAIGALPPEARRQMTWDALLQFGSALGQAPDGYLGSGIAQGAQAFGDTRNQYMAAYEQQQMARAEAQRQQEQAEFEQWLALQGVQDQQEDNARANRQLGLDEEKFGLEKGDRDRKRKAAARARKAAIAAAESSGMDPASPEYAEAMAHAKAGKADGVGKVRERYEKERGRRDYLTRIGGRLTKSGIDPDDPNALEKDLALFEQQAQQRYAAPQSDPARGAWRIETKLDANGVPMKYYVNPVTREESLFGPAVPGGGGSGDDDNLRRITLESFSNQPFTPAEYMARENEFRRMMPQRPTAPAPGQGAPQELTPDMVSTMKDIIQQANPGMSEADVGVELRRQIAALRAQGRVR
jgi:hypothetical protein